MSCAYITGLAENNVDIEDAENLSSRGAAPLAGVGKSSVNNHRAGTCACGQDTTPDVVDTPEPTGRRDSVELGESGGSFVYHTTDPEPIKNWDDVLTCLGVDPSAWAVVSKTVKVSRWEQSARAKDGSRDRVGLSAYRAQIAPKRDDAVTDSDIEAARTRIQGWQLPRRIPGTGLGAPVAAVLNLADIQGGKDAGGGVAATEQRLYDGLENFNTWVGRQRAGGRNIEELVIVNNGDPYEGCAGNYDGQLFSVELNLRGQMNFVLDVWGAYARELYPQFDKGQFVSVLCNHSEMGRFGGRKNQTNDADSGGAFLAESLQRILQGRPEFDHVKFTIPNDEMNVYADISGVPVGFNHGHKIPGNDATGFEKWLNGQARGDRKAWEAKVWITAHRHNFQCFDLGSTTVFQCPSADGGSKWLRDMTGKFARSGILAMLIGQHDPLGWSDPVFL